MAKKSVIGDAADAFKSVAGAALGAAAGAATGVVAETVAGAMTEGGKKLGEAAPRLEKAAAQRVSRPILPSAKKRAAPKRKSKAKKKKVTALRAAKAKRSVKRRKKR